MPPFSFEPGSPHPFGARPAPGGVNFSLFSQEATEVVLLLFDRDGSPEPVQEIRLDPYLHKTFHIWHIFIRELPAWYHYAFRIDGPIDTSTGHRFNPNKVLIDPYARAISKTLWSRPAACTPADNLATSMRGIVLDTSVYDWEGDQQLKRPLTDSIIYEMHAGGFTKSPSSQVAHPGTFAGVVEKIPYFQELGVTAVELLPVFEFDETEGSLDPQGNRLTNYWGYNTVNFFGPHSGYCVSPATGAHVNEFRDMVKALHKAGIEVILDVVFNHTSEGDQLGPTFSFRGIDNRTYYILDPTNRSVYQNFSGVGNTFNANHPLCQKFILDCLRYYVGELHVDGFRFDEGSILSRGEDGAPLEHPPVVWQVELDDALSDTKMIAEAWDAAGLYQVGHFPGDRWSEWNGRYRDDVRRFVRGEAGLTSSIASRIGGSSDIYQARDQTPQNSINFITCHDGFTMNDLVSYDRKHNEANGESNRDGNDNNMSWNCGVEGETTDPSIEALRERQIRNFATILMLSRGVPMILAGDEVRRTQQGNNNAYNQDNAVGWFDWSLNSKNQGMLRFWRLLINLRRHHSSLRHPYFYNGEVNERGVSDISWHGTLLNAPGFDDPNARALAFTIAGFGGEPDLHVMMNMYWEPLDFQVPGDPERAWRLALDTLQPSPNDIFEPGQRPDFPHQTCTVQPHSIVMLAA